jgi:hypothetical protein
VGDDDVAEMDHTLAAPFSLIAFMYPSVWLTGLGFLQCSRASLALGCGFPQISHLRPILGLPTDLFASGLLTE